jgi:hypothetical protein
VTTAIKPKEQIELRTLRIQATVERLKDLHFNRMLLDPADVPDLARGLDEIASESESILRELLKID